MAKDRSEKVSISKEVLPELPPEYSKTNLGDPRGSKRQYRSSTAHVREYEDRFTIHIDREDPRKNPVGHLLRDSPETIAAFATNLYFAKKRSDKKEETGSSQLKFSLLGFLLSFFFLNHAFRHLKEILF